MICVHRSHPTPDIDIERIHKFSTYVRVSNSMRMMQFKLMAFVGDCCGCNIIQNWNFLEIVRQIDFTSMPDHTIGKCKYYGAKDDEG